MPGDFKIEKGVPQPPPKDPKPPLYPLHQMEVGDSFKFPGKLRQSVNGVARHYASKWRGIEFAIHPDGDDFRIWRIK